MDMRLSIEDRKIKSRLYAKPMALYLYIPPHSSHAPGMISGLVFGNVLRIYQLNSSIEDVETELCLFYGRLMDRGYPREKLTPLFSKAMENASRYLSRSESYRAQLKAEKMEAARRQVFYHVPYHPNNPSSSEIQRLWREIVFAPPGKTQLNHLTSHGFPIPIDRMIVCYHRAPNLNNLFSYRKLDKIKGLKVSSYL